MTVLKSIDTIVNFVPRLPERAINQFVRGPDALGILPAVIIGYLAGCAAQGFAVSYAIAESGGTPFQSVAGGFITTLVPPSTALLNMFYAIKKP